MTARESALRLTGLRVLTGYLVFALALALWSAARGDGGLPAAGSYAVLLGVILVVVRSNGKIAVIVRDWLPLLALPVLYAAIPITAVSVGPFDSMVQSWDRAVFQSDPARVFAGVAPWAPLSELFHAAYLSYYAIIYLPPLVMYGRGDYDAFRKTIAGVTMAMVVCFGAFCLFPVSGPRYVWPPPLGVPHGLFRQLVVAILEVGSSRGTAFPSSHQAIALAMGLSSVAWDRRWGAVIVALSGLLGLGAVYGGFHYGADMLAGAAVGLVSWAVVGNRATVPAA